MIRIATAIVAAGFLTACAATIPVKGNTSEVMSFAGRWEGRFQERNSDRHGKVVFELETGRHTGEGKVIAYVGDDESKSQTLTIKVVKLAGDAVTGTIAPHVDPRCNCTVKTEFKGEMRDDSIVGSYVVRSADGAITRDGEWSADRFN